MKLSEFGGEFKLIADITARFGNFHNVHTTVGDDAAVVRVGDSFMVITTDVLVEDQHFSRKWSTPCQIGLKTLEANVSDVVAMGARPELLLLNLVLPDGIEVEFVQELYRAIREGCERYRITLIGGDTNAGPVLMLGATLTGTTDRPVLRSGARVGDLICVTGDVGASCAGLMLLRKGVELRGRVRTRHLEPRCRHDVARKIAPFATAMIDISDGVASETLHICERSRVGAVIEAGRLPIHPETSTACRTTGIATIDCALSGGEDFELLFTLPPDKVAELKARVSDFTVIGEIVDRSRGACYLGPDGTRNPLPRGFDHFGLEKA